jgi:hypothetical protein
MERLQEPCQFRRLALFHVEHPKGRFCVLDSRFLVAQFWFFAILLLGPRCPGTHTIGSLKTMTRDAIQETLNNAGMDLSTINERLYRLELRLRKDFPGIDVSEFAQISNEILEVKERLAMAFLHSCEQEK